MVKRNLIFSAAAIVFLALVWIVAYFSVRNDYVLPTLWETLRQMGRLFTEASFWRAFFNTFLRALWAFLGSFVLGVGLAVLAHLQGGARAFLAPVISVLRTVPTMAVVLMLLLWTSPAVAPVLVAGLVLFPAVYAAALAALDEVGESYGGLVRAFRIPVGRQISKMYLPLAAPLLLKQAGSVFSLGLKVIVSGEVLASTFRSLGGMMQEAQLYLNMPRLMALTLFAVLLGFIVEGAFRLLYFVVVRWRAWS